MASCTLKRTLVEETVTTVVGSVCVCVAQKEGFVLFSPLFPSGSEGPYSGHYTCRLASHHGSSYQGHCCWDVDVIKAGNC